MPYNPTFLRPAKGNFSPDRGFIHVRAGTDAYLLEDELNELQAVLSYNDRLKASQIFTSGPIAAITNPAVSGTDLLSFDKFVALVDGLPITVGGA
ncbi:MAG TPA: hypothetical protein VK464_14005, partial [Symbiobacteriaceae bacterium]|nr:hypothetical protein [Symbiobacteriaceae bacterium]